MIRTAPVTLQIPGDPTTRTVTAEEQASLNGRAAMSQILLGMPVHDAIGVCCAYLLWAAFSHPAAVKRALLEPVVREGFRGVSLLKTLTRVVNP